MKINPIQQNSKSTKGHCTSFKAIKSIKCKGLYKKNSQYAQELVEAIKDNNTAMNFCKKYDVDVVLGREHTRTYLCMNFINPIKSKFLGILGSKKDSIIVEYYYDNFIDANNRLKNNIAEVIGKPIPELSMNINSKESKINSGLELDKSIVDMIARTV